MKSGYWTREFILGLFHLITPYWNSEEKKSARLYLAAIITLTIAAVYMTLLLNEWFNSFYSALQNYDSDAVYRGLLRFTGLAFAHIAFAVYSYYLQQRLALRWRKWMTKNYLAKWTGQQMYYRLEMFSQGTADNPDQRISEDINLFTARTLSFMSGLLRSATTIVCFIFVLWNLSEILSFSAAGQEIHIYGYLVWTALAYSVLGTWITHKVGHRHASTILLMYTRMIPNIGMPGASKNAFSRNRVSTKSNPKKSRVIKVKMMPPIFSACFQKLSS